MKCCACWTDKAYRRSPATFKEHLLAYLGFVPLKCQHCYHKFCVPAFRTWGQTLDAPVLRPPTLSPASVPFNPSSKTEKSLDDSTAAFSARRAA